MKKTVQSEDSTATVLSLVIILVVMLGALGLNLRTISVMQSLGYSPSFTGIVVGVGMAIDLFVIFLILPPVFHAVKSKLHSGKRHCIDQNGGSGLK